MKTASLIMIIGSLILSQASGAVVYVNASATGDNNGTSWADAYKHLQSAISAAVTGDQVWVAAGTYMPDGGYIPIDGTHVPGNKSRSTSFQLNGGVSYYGGFNGTETNLSQRNWQTNMTTLSGDLNNDDAPGLSNYSENSYVVARASSDYIILDGFRIAGANNPSQGGGLYCPGYRDIVVSNCTFANNKAYDGGGIFGGIELFVNNCTFINNIANREGGGINPGGSSTITNCTFVGNKALNGGGFFTNGGDRQTYMVNSTFIGNSGVNRGGGYYKYYGDGSKIINCTFSQNDAYLGGGVFNNDGVLSIENTILWQNWAYYYSEIYGNELIVSSSDIMGIFVSGNNINANPLFVEVPSPGSDGIWGTDDDNYGNLRLQSGSPCIDVGNNSLVPLGVNTDINGISRFLDGNADNTVAVDIGACEHQPSMSTEPGCGDKNHPYPAMDFDKDCRVNLTDFSIFAAHWMDCTALDCD